MVEPVHADNKTPDRPACAHAFCRACIIDHLASDGADGKQKQHCPVCLQPLTGFQLVDAAALSRIIGGLKFTCPECKETVADPRQHFGKLDCPRKCDVIQCCNKRKMDANAYTRHQLQCPKMLFRCEVCGVDQVLRKDINDHFAGCWHDVDVKKSLRMRIRPGDRRYVVWTDKEVSWSVHLTYMGDDKCRTMLRLYSSQHHYSTLQLRATIKNVKWTIVHPVTGEQLFTVCNEAPCEMSTVAYSSECAADFTLSQLKQFGAYDPDKGLIELLFRVQFTVERLWDAKAPVAQGRSKRQKIAAVPVPSSAPLCCELGHEELSVKPDAAVQVIVAD